MGFKLVSDEFLEEKIVLTKIQVGERQLNTSIRMFFFDEDEVSTHTIISASHGVIRDLAKEKNIDKSFKDSVLIAKSDYKKFINSVNLPQNYFKHADRDSNDKLVFSYNLTPFYILDAILLLVSLTKNISYEMKVFLLWAQIRFPDVICYNPSEKFIEPIRQAGKDEKYFRYLGKLLLKEYYSNKKAEKCISNLKEK